MGLRQRQQPLPHLLVERGRAAAGSVDVHEHLLAGGKQFLALRVVEAVVDVQALNEAANTTPRVR